MGDFANTLFSVLMGWAKNAISWLWCLFDSEEAGGLMGWVLDNWLGLLILLCVVGVLIDLLVYLLRWQPYRVWRSFLHRGEADEAPAAPADTGDKELLWVYANGSTAPEPYPADSQEIPQPLLEEPPQVIPQELPGSRPAQRVIPARRRRTADGSVEYILPPSGDARGNYRQPYYPPQWRRGGHPTEDDGGMQE